MNTQEDLNATAVENETDNDSDSQDIQGKRISFPGKPVKPLIDFVSVIYTRLGFGQYHTKEAIAQAHNLQYASIKASLAASKSLGLLDLKHGTGYRVTDLFVKIYKPSDNAEKLTGVVECLKTFDVFKTLIEDYNGHVVPELEGLANIIERGHEIPATTAIRLARLFRENLEDYNLIGSMGVLNVNFPKGKPTTPPVDEKPNSGNSGESKINTPPADKIEILIPLPSGQRAHLWIPEKYEPADLERIAKFVDALK